MDRVYTLTKQSVGTPKVEVNSARPTRSGEVISIHRDWGLF